MINYDFPIDLVYLWCDINDNAWNDKRLKYLSHGNLLDQQAINDCRFINNDELKYSLRSVAQYASWINHIYIVSDHQTPNWLNTNNQKITMINHEDILPVNNLPLFNSEAIETALHKIPNLSEHFLYSNDDSFFGDNVYPWDFFNYKGQAIVRLLNNPKKNKIEKSQYSQHIDYMQQLAKKTLGRMFYHQPHHNIDAYLKSEFKNCVAYYDDLVLSTSQQRFRQDPAFQRSIIAYWMISSKKGVQKNIKKWKSKLLNKIPFLSVIIKQDSVCCNISSIKGLKRLRNIKPKMFCLNDCEKATQNDRESAKSFMKELFPYKSEFEL